MIPGQQQPETLVTNTTTTTTTTTEIHPVVGWCVIILTFSGLAIAFPAFRYLVILLAAIAARSLLFIPSMLFVGLAFFAPDPNVMREVVSGMGEAMIPQDFMNRVLGNLTACL